MLEPFNPSDAAQYPALLRVWNAACGPHLPLNARLLAYNTQPSLAITQAGCLACHDGAIAGWVLASSSMLPFATTGWIDALVVAPNAQRQDIGGALLGWAERWLAARGHTSARLGGSLRPFAPGLPVELGTAAFVERHGYAAGGAEWDVARRLSDYVPRQHAANAGARVAPVEHAQSAALLRFLEQDFPGRWAWEVGEYLRGGGRSSDVLALWVGGAVQGFCQVTLADSARPIERFYPQRLPHPWGQLGPIGVGAAQRGKGHGALLLDAGLRHLRAHGVDGCVIDWTDLLAFYGKFDFAPYREYRSYAKDLDAGV